MTDSTPNPIIQEAGRLRYAMRRRITHVCPECGKEFEGLVNKVRCSNKCKVASYRARKRAKEGS